MVEHRLEARLHPVLRRVRSWYTALSVAGCWGAVALTAGVVWWSHRSLGLDGPTWAVSLATIAALGTLVAWQWARSMAGTLTTIARRLEACFPDLDARLLTAVEFRTQGTRLTYLQEQVLRQVLSHEFRNRWTKLVPGRRLVIAYAAVLGAGVALVGTLVLVGSLSPPVEGSGDAQLRLVLDEPTTGPVSVEPGNASIEKDSPVLVTARFANNAPLKAELVIEDSQTGTTVRHAMVRSLDDPLFGSRIDAVRGPMRYRIEYPGGASDWYALSVFEFPRVLRFDLRLEYPSYTNLPEKVLADVRRASAVVGTKIHVTGYVNKPVEYLKLVDRQGNAIVLRPDSEDSCRYMGYWTLTESNRWRAELRDHEGRRDKPPVAELSIQAIPNRPPEIKWIAPGRDVRVTPLEELSLAGQAVDDFGLMRYGIAVQFGGHDPVEVVLGERTPGGTRQMLQYVLDFESQQARPDQLASFYWWAEDYNDQGQLRRVESDMYFAEVRPFEEIFREGQNSGEQAEQESRSSSNSPNASAAEQLADLQKEIINGTWKLKRSDKIASRPDEYRSDARLLAESQQSAIEQLQQLGQELQDLQSLGHMADALRWMQSASQLLEKAAETLSPQSLLEALTPEKSAYEALLKLRAREHQVVRSRQRSRSSSSGSGNNSPLQEQLDQLELRHDPNRYETERQATSDEDPRQRELRRNLSRLRELARRQQDLNEQVRQLEAALRQASTEEERRALERQLKRLRDEQEEILRDTEELQQRMEQQSQEGALREEQQQLEQTRENVRRASEALEQGRLSQALTEGTRAEKNFRQLQDQLRQRAASQYADAVRQLRQEARSLQERQEQIAQRMQQTANASTNSLRDDQDQSALPDQLRSQATQLRSLFETIEKLVQQAEEDEPLLSRRLYEAYRQAQMAQPEQRLEQAAEWMQRGFPDQSTQPEQQAREAIQQLTRDIEEAAESVLGSELETLRRAQRELERALEDLRGTRREASDAPADQPSETANAEHADSTTPPDEQVRPAPGQRADSFREFHRDDRRNPDEASATQRPTGDTPEPSPDQQRSDVTGERSSRNATDDNASANAASPNSPSENGGENPPATNSRQNAPSRRPQERENRSENGGRENPSPRNSMRQIGPEAVTDGSRSGGPEQWGGFRWPTGGVIWGERFQEWADRLRDVEELLDEPRMRAELSRIRDRARNLRAEFKRHSQLPTWDLVREQIERPLSDLRDQIDQQIRRLDRSDRLAPIDHDPVPPQYDEQVRRYYERLGSRGQ